MVAEPPRLAQKISDRIIGTSLGYTFSDFITNTGAVAAICFVLMLAYFTLCFRKEFKSAERENGGAAACPAPSTAVTNKAAFFASAGVFLLAVVLLITHAQTELSVACIGVIVAALTTKYRDLAMLVTFGVQLWMYATPVTYSSSMIADKFPNLLGLYMLNPITPIIELFRAAFLGAADYSLKYNALSMGVTLLVAALGVVLFSHTEKTFMDTV